KLYAWAEPISDTNLHPIPPELERLLNTPTQGHSSVRDRVNTAQALNGVPEGQRDETLFKLACKLRSADVPQDAAEKLILEAAHNCQPPFPERMALEKVAHAYQKYPPRQPQAAPGNQAEIWPEFLSAKEILQAPKDPTRWIVSESLPAGGASV